MKIDLTKEEWEFFLQVCLYNENRGYSTPFLGPTLRAKILEKLGSEWVDDDHCLKCKNEKVAISLLLQEI